MRSKEYYEKKLQKDGNLCVYEEIVCPHCFQRDDDPMAFSLEDDGDTEDEVECRHCTQLFDIKVKVEKTYTTTKTPED
jgi:DNA-directed RNA polymerase subunit RPC12/RpoP